MVSGIYKITISDDALFYIGSSRHIKERTATHTRLLRSRKHHSYKMQRDYNVNKTLRVEIIETCEESTLIEREQFYIDTLNPHYNICKVAGRTTNRKMSAEQVLKQSRPIVQIDMITTNIIGEFQSATVAHQQTGVKQTSITTCCRKRYKSAGNFYWSYKDSYTPTDFVSKPQSNKRRPVIQLTMEGNFIKKWASISEAIKKGGFNRSINNCCLGRTKSSQGYVWAYENNPFNPQLPIQKLVHMYSKDGTYIKSFAHSQDAQDQLGIARTTIAKLCKKSLTNNLAGGYRWSYEKTNKLALYCKQKHK